MEILKIDNADCTGLVLDRRPSGLILARGTCPTCELWRSWTLRPVPATIDYDENMDFHIVTTPNYEVEGVEPWWIDMETEQQVNLTPTNTEKHKAVIYWKPEPTYIPMCRRIYHYLCKFEWANFEADDVAASNTYTFAYTRTGLQGRTFVRSCNGGALAEVDGLEVPEWLMNTTVKGEEASITKLASKLTVKYKFLSYLQAQLDASSYVGDSPTTPEGQVIPENTSGCVYVDDITSTSPKWLCDAPYRNPCSSCCLQIESQSVLLQKADMKPYSETDVHDTVAAEYDVASLVAKGIKKIKVWVTKQEVKDVNGDVVPISLFSQTYLGVAIMAGTATTVSYDDTIFCNDPDHNMTCFTSDSLERGMIVDISGESPPTHIILEYLIVGDETDHASLDFDVTVRISPVIDSNIEGCGDLVEQQLEPEDSYKTFRAWDEDFNCNNLDGHTLLTKPTNENNILKYKGDLIWSLFFCDKLHQEDTETFNGNRGSSHYYDPIPRYGTAASEAPFIQCNTGRWVREQHEIGETTLEAWDEWELNHVGSVYYYPYDAYKATYGEPDVSIRFDVAWVAEPNRFPKPNEEFMISISAVHYRWDVWPLLICADGGRVTNPLEDGYFYMARCKISEDTDCTPVWVSPPGEYQTPEACYCTVGPTSVEVNEPNGTLIQSSHLGVASKTEREKNSSVRAEPMILIKCPTQGMINSYNDETGGAGLSGEWQTAE